MNRKRETKSKKVNLGFRPSVWSAFQQIAYVQNTSPNNILSDYVDWYIKEHQDELGEFEKLMRSFDGDVKPV